MSVVLSRQEGRGEGGGVTDGPPGGGGRAARMRRRRGYAWEDLLVKRFNGAGGGWQAFRLGSPSVALPDILAVNNRTRTLYIVEAKSGTGTTLRVPGDQVARCLRWTDTFRAYRTRGAVLAFKFLSKKRVGTGRYESRGLREFFKARIPAWIRWSASARTTAARTRSGAASAAISC